MTSTNDGKDVKSNQTSGPKGKTYYIELYKSLEAGLSKDCELSERTQNLCNAWRRVHSLCAHSASSTHPHLLSWLQRHTARTVLQTEWQDPTNKAEQSRLEEAIDDFITESRSSKDGDPPWQTQLVARGEWFKRILASPWGHPVLKMLLDPQGEETPTDEEVLTWLKDERGVMFVTRLRQLAATKNCHDLALRLASAIMDRVRAGLDPPKDDQVDDPKEKERLELGSPFLNILKAEAGFTVDVLEMLTDIEFVLLHKRDKRAQCIDLAKQTPLRYGYQLVERLQSRLGTSPREKKLWKNAKEVATLIAQVVIARCMVVPSCLGVARTALYCCTRSLVRLVAAARLPAAAQQLAMPAATARHLHTLAAAVDAQSLSDMKPHVCELYVRAITAGMNELERLKLNPEKEPEARAAEQMLSQWFLQLGGVLAASERMRGECTLTAFSVHPSPAMYDNLKDAPALAAVALDIEPKSEQTNSEYGSWASDSRSQTNFVKTSETLNLKKHTQHQANVLSTAILTEGEALGLSPELCQDIVVLLSGPRLKTLSWDMDRTLLLENCRTYMERTNFGTRALTTELKYLNLDLREYEHLPEEEEDDSDMYYGIEKGYEHLVEFQEAEEIWQDANDSERTDSAYPSDMEPELNKPKRKFKKIYLDSDEDEDPLSMLAEASRVERKKERPHSKERKERKPRAKTKPKDIHPPPTDPNEPTDPLEIGENNTQNDAVGNSAAADADNKKPAKKKQSADRKKNTSTERKTQSLERKKEPKEKKERKRKEKSVSKESKAPLSSLIGMKIANMANKKQPLDSEFDSLGNYSIPTEGSQADVLFDGLFSMDEVRSPEKSFRNNEMHMANGSIRMNTSTPNQEYYRRMETIRVPTPNRIGTPVRTPTPTRTPTPNRANTPCFNRSDTRTPDNFTVTEEVKKSITRLIEFRRHKAAFEAQQQNIFMQPNLQPNAKYVQPQPHLQPHISQTKPDYMRTYSNNSHQNTIQEAYTLNKKKSVAQPVIQFGPNQIQQTNFIDATGMKVNAEPQKLTNYTNAKIGTKIPEMPCRPKSVTHPQTKPIKTTPHQKDFHVFLKELQESINAGTGGQAKKEVKPTNRINPVVPKSDPKVTPSAKHPVKIPDSAPNTFSRLSYYKSTKNDIKAKLLVDAIVEQQSQKIQKNEIKAKNLVDAIVEQQQHRLTNSPSFADLDRILEEQKQAKIKYMQTAKESVIKPQRPSANTQNMNKRSPSMSREHPSISGMLNNNLNVSKTSVNQWNNVQAEKPRDLSNKLSSSLTEKDQQDLVLLLRQQSKQNLTRPIANTSKERVPPPPPQATSSSTVPTYKVPSLVNKRVLDLSTSVIKNNPSQAKPSKSAKPAKERRPAPKPIIVKTELSHAKNLNQAHSKIQKVEVIDNEGRSVKSSASGNKGKQDGKSTDWESVMDALLKHKTPSRGPNALDMTLKNVTFMSAFENSLRDQGIVKPPSRSSSETMLSTSDAKVSPTKPEAESVIEHSQSVSVLRRSNTDIKKTAKAKTKKGTANPSVEVQMNPSSSVSMQHPENRSLLESQLPKKVNTDKKLKDATKRRVERKQQFTCPLPKEDDPFISGIPNSDYDLLEELMDDDLRQEIGELLSDDDCYNAAIPGVKNARAFVGINKTISSVTQEDKRIIPPPVINAFPKPQQKNNIRKAPIGLSKPNYDATISIGEPAGYSNVLVRPEYTKAQKIITQPTTNIINQMPAPVIAPSKPEQYVNATVDQTFVAVPQPTSLQNVVLIGSDLVYQPCVQAIPAVRTPIHTALPQNTYVSFNPRPNIGVYQTTHYPPPIINPLIIGNAITTSSVPVTAPPFTTSIMSPKPHTAPEVAQPQVVQPQGTQLIWTQPQTQMSQPLMTQPLMTQPQMIQPQMSQPHITQLQMTQPQMTGPQSFVVDSCRPHMTQPQMTQPQTTQPQMAQPQVAKETISLEPQKLINPSSNTRVDYLQDDVILNDKCDNNSNKNSERKVLSEVQELIYKEKVDLNTKLSFKNDVKKAADAERLKLKRMAILNRNINHRSNIYPIPLTYTPLITKKPEADVMQENIDLKSTDASSNDAMVYLSLPPYNAVTNTEEPKEIKEVANENCKENNTEAAPCRRILLRSSNKLKSEVVVSSTVKTPPMQTKAKLKVASDTDEPLKSAESSDDAPTPDTGSPKVIKKRASKKTPTMSMENAEIKKRITRQSSRNALAKSENDKQSDQEHNVLIVPDNTEEKSVATNNNPPVIDVFDLLDIEDQLESAKILKKTCLKTSLMEDENDDTVETQPVSIKGNNAEKVEVNDGSNEVINSPTPIIIDDDSLLQSDVITSEPIKSNNITANESIEKVNDDNIESVIEHSNEAVNLCDEVTDIQNKQSNTNKTEELPLLKKDMVDITEPKDKVKHTEEASTVQKESDKTKKSKANNAKTKEKPSPVRKDTVDIKESTEGVTESKKSKNKNKVLTSNDSGKYGTNKIDEMPTVAKPPSKITQSTVKTRAQKITATEEKATENNIHVQDTEPEVICLDNDDDRSSTNKTNLQIFKVVDNSLKTKNPNTEKHKEKDSDWSKAFLEGVTIEEINQPGINDPLRRCVRIKLPNGRAFKATVRGQAHISIDTIFSDPALKSVLMRGDVNRRDKYTLNIKQCSTQNTINKKIDTRIQEISIQTPEGFKKDETISLLSDDEEEDFLYFDTEFGKYKVPTMQSAVHKKHQGRLNNKCVVQLTRENLTRPEDVKQPEFEMIVPDELSDPISETATAEIPESTKQLSKKDIDIAESSMKLLDSISKYITVKASTKRLLDPITKEIPTKKIVPYTTESTEVFRHSVPYKVISEKPKISDTIIPDLLLKPSPKEILSLDTSNAVSFEPEVIEIDDSSNDDTSLDLPGKVQTKDEKMEDKILELKSLLLKDLGVEETYENFKLELPTKPIKEMSGELIIPDIITDALTKSLETSPVHTSRYASLPVVDRKCFVALTNCDDLVKKYGKLKQCSVKLIRCDESINLESTNDKTISDLPEIELEDDFDLDSAPVSRSGSFSILIKRELLNGPSEEIIRNTSPVMEVYESIADLFNRQSENKLQKHKWICETEWFMSKTVIHLLFGNMKCKVNDPNNTEYLNDTTEFYNATNMSRTETEDCNIKVPNLVTILTKFFQTNSVWYKIGNYDKKSLKLKRKSQDNAQVVSKLFKMRRNSIVEQICYENTEDVPDLQADLPKTSDFVDITAPVLMQNETVEQLTSLQDIEQMKDIATAFIHQNSDDLEIQNNDTLSTDVSTEDTLVENELPTIPSSPLAEPLQNDDNTDLVAIEEKYSNDCEGIYTKVLECEQSDNHEVVFVCDPPELMDRCSTPVPKLNESSVSENISTDVVTVQEQHSTDYNDIILGNQESIDSVATEPYLINDTTTEEEISSDCHQEEKHTKHLKNSIKEQKDSDGILINHYKSRDENITPFDAVRTIQDKESFILENENSLIESEIRNLNSIVGPEPGTYNKVSEIMCTDVISAKEQESEDNTQISSVDLQESLIPYSPENDASEAESQSNNSNDSNMPTINEHLLNENKQVTSTKEKAAPPSKILTDNEALSSQNEYSEIIDTELSGFQNIESHDCLNKIPALPEPNITENTEIVINDAIKNENLTFCVVPSSKISTLLVTTISESNTNDASELHDNNIDDCGRHVDINNDLKTPCDCEDTVSSDAIELSQSMLSLPSSEITSGASEEQDDIILNSNNDTLVGDNVQSSSDNEDKTTKLEETKTSEMETNEAYCDNDTAVDKNMLSSNTRSENTQSEETSTTSDITKIDSSASNDAINSVSATREPQQTRNEKNTGIDDLLKQDNEENYEGADDKQETESADESVMLYSSNDSTQDELQSEIEGDSRSQDNKSQDNKTIFMQEDSNVDVACISDCMLEESNNAVDFIIAPEPDTQNIISHVEISNDYVKVEINKNIEVELTTKDVSHENSVDYTIKVTDQTYSENVNKTSDCDVNLSKDIVRSRILEEKDKGKHTSDVMFDDISLKLQKMFGKDKNSNISELPVEKTKIVNIIEQKHSQNKIKFVSSIQYLENVNDCKESSDSIKDVQSTDKSNSKIDPNTIIGVLESTNKEDEENYKTEINDDLNLLKQKQTDTAVEISDEKSENARNGNNSTCVTERKIKTVDFIENAVATDTIKTSDEEVAQIVLGSATSDNTDKNAQNELVSILGEDWQTQSTKDDLIKQLTSDETCSSNESLPDDNNVELKRNELVKDIVEVGSNDELEQELARIVLGRAESGKSDRQILIINADNLEFNEVKVCCIQQTELQKLIRIDNQDFNPKLSLMDYENSEVQTSHLIRDDDDCSQTSDDILQITQEIDEFGNVKEIDIRLNVPKRTYSRKTLEKDYTTFGDKRSKRNLKRRGDMTDSKTPERKYRKGKNIDTPKLTVIAKADTAYSKEYKQLFDYCSSVKFSYSRPFHKENIDVEKMLKSWPIQGNCNVEVEAQIDENLFNDIDTITRSIHDPLTLTLAEEIMAEYSENSYSLSDTKETNFQMGFGEGSGRVIQNSEDDGVLKFSAATLSDVKQTQPLLPSEIYDKCNSVLDSDMIDSTKHEIERLQRNYKCIQLKNKVRTFFKNSMAELNNEWAKQLDKNDDNYLNEYLPDNSCFPYGLNQPDFIRPSPVEVVVQVVQVGQLPVSAAAQNPVTCDPRVTQVSNASPSQCSADNSLSDDPHSTIKTEYTELTTADISLPLQNYVPHHHHHLVPSDSHNMQLSHDIIIEDIKEEIKEEIVDEPEMCEDISNHYDNDRMSDYDSTHIGHSNFNNNVDYTYQSTPTNHLSPTTAVSETTLDIMYNSTDKTHEQQAQHMQLAQQSEQEHIAQNEQAQIDHQNQQSQIEYQNEQTHIVHQNHQAQIAQQNQQPQIAQQSQQAQVPQQTQQTQESHTQIQQVQIAQQNQQAQVELNSQSQLQQQNSQEQLQQPNTQVRNQQEPPPLQNQQAQPSHQDRQEQRSRSAEKTDQIAHAMNAAGISTSSETSPNTRAHALVNILSQKLRQGTVGAPTASAYPKTRQINALALQQALAQILPPPLKPTNNNSENNQQNATTPQPQVVHIVQGNNASGNQITLVDNSQPSVISTPNATPVLHIVQNKGNASGSISNGTPPQHTNSFSGLSLVEAGLQQGNQLVHIVNAGNQKNANAGQLLRKVNLLTNLANVQGSNEQKMVQFVCKSADGKSIQLNGPHQRSMVLRLHPVESPGLQLTQSKPAESTDANPSSVTFNSVSNKDAASQQEIKSRSVYEENYAKFIQSSNKPATEKGTSLPKFGQAFGKQVFQEGAQKNDATNGNSHLSAGSETSDCQPNDNAINMEHISQISSPPLLLRKSPQTSQAQPNLVQQLKQTISPMNMSMHGGVIYTRQFPVNIGGGKTINLITVPSSDLIDDSASKQTVNQDGVEPSIIKIVPQAATSSSETLEENNSHASGSNETATPQPQPVLTQMRIKLPMLSKGPQMVSGARLVRPSFFQIQRNVIGGANQPVYQQLVLTAAPPLGQQTIRLPQTQTGRQAKVASDNQSSSESQMSSSTLEQLREFDLVLEQVKERSTGTGTSTAQPSATSASSTFKLHTLSTNTTDNASSASSTPAQTTQQVLYSIGNSQPLNVTYVNRKVTSATPTTSSFQRSPDSSGIVESSSSSSHRRSRTVTSESSASDTPASSSNASHSGNSTQQSKPTKPKPKPRPKAPSNPPNTLKLPPAPPKPSTQKPAEDEQTTQRILYILAEYKEQVENSPDKDKPAPRRRTNLPASAGSSKRKKSCSGSRRSGRDMSPCHGDESCRTMGSEDSSCGNSQGDCTDCHDCHSPQGSPRKVVRKLTFDNESPTHSRSQHRNVIMADGQTITVARGASGKPTTTVLMPANYILPVSMMKGGRQIAIVTNRGPKLLTMGAAEGTTNALLLQRLIGPTGLKPVLTRPGVRHVRLPTAALQNLQAFNLAAAAQATTVQPPDSTASPAPAPTPDLVDTRATTNSPWRSDRESHSQKSDRERTSSPEGSEPWNLPPADYSYEETVRSENMDRTVLVVHKRDASAHRQHRFASMTAHAHALRSKYNVLEQELNIQKTLSEECEDLGVDSPSASELFPEAELLFASSPAHDHTQDHGQHSYTPQPLLSQSGISQPDMEDQIATDQLLPRCHMHDDRELGLGLEDVGIVTVSADGMQATIQLDQEEFARSHPNTTFHSEPTDDEVVQQPITLSGLKSRHVTSTIFHSHRPQGTVLMTAAPQTTVISQATAETSGNHRNAIKYADIDNMIDCLPSAHSHNVNLSSVLVKDDGPSRFDNLLNDSRELHLANAASAIVHSAGHATQVIRRVCYATDKRERESRFLMDDEPDGLIAGDDAKMTGEDSSREATLESTTGSSPERNAELFWESNSASGRADFSSDSDKCCKSSDDASTDSSGPARLQSVIRAPADAPLRTYPGGRRAGRGVVRRACPCCAPAAPRAKRVRRAAPGLHAAT